MKSRLFSCFIFLALCATQFVWAQATVNEALETAFIYVDVNKGSDSNPGTQSEPLKSIGAAATIAEDNNRKGIGTRVTINPGLYRESITIASGYHETALPITLQSSASGVVITGAVQYTGWVSYSGNSEIYTASWLNDWGNCPVAGGNSPLEQEIVLRQEMIFVNGTPLTQVLSFGQMVAGTFYVNETNHLAYIWPVSGTNMNTADVEVATEPVLLELISKQNVVVRGITFQYANTCRDNSAVPVAGTSQNILFVNDTFQWNNAMGLHFADPVTYFTVQNSTALHNGQSGMMSVQTKYGAWKTVTSAFNNWRGAQGSYYYWNSAGIHFYADHDHTVNGLVTAYNQTHGVHWDTDNANITVNNMLAAQNLGAGVLVEKSEGPVTLSGSAFCGNNQGVKLNYQYQAGLILRNSEHVTAVGNSFYGNQTSQIGVIGQKGGILVTNWETGEQYNLRSQNFTATGNTIAAIGSGQDVFADSYLNDSDWTDFQTTLTSNKNTWWNGSNTSAFVVPVVQLHPLSGWQSVTGQDALSTWSNPGNMASACAATPVTDYWLLVSNSSQTVAPGGSTTFSLTMIPFNGLTGTAALSFDGTSEVKGLSGTLSVTSAPLSGAFSLVVKAAANTAPGTYPITVIATNGGKARTVTTSLVVN